MMNSGHRLCEVFWYFARFLILIHNDMLLHGRIGIGKEIQEKENIRKDKVRSKMI